MRAQGRTIQLGGADTGSLALYFATLCVMLMLFMHLMTAGVRPLVYAALGRELPCQKPQETRSAFMRNLVRTAGMYICSTWCLNCVELKVAAAAAAVLPTAAGLLSRRGSRTSLSHAQGLLFPLVVAVACSAGVLTCAVGGELAHAVAFGWGARGA